MCLVAGSKVLSIAADCPARKVIVSHAVIKCVFDMQYIMIKVNYFTLSNDYKCDVL